MAHVLESSRHDEQSRAYKGFVISPSVLSAPGGGFWFILAVFKHFDDGTAAHHFPQPNASFSTAEAAEAAAVRLGHQIIDGEIPGYFI